MEVFSLVLPNDKLKVLLLCTPSSDHATNLLVMCFFCCYCSMARVAHSGMTTEEVTENIEATVSTVVNKIRLVSSKPTFAT